MPLSKSHLNRRRLYYIGNIIVENMIGTCQICGRFNIGIFITSNNYALLEQLKQEGTIWHKQNIIDKNQIIT